MKKLALLFTAFLFLSNAFSQAPVIEGKYLPVMNTCFQQAWDTTASDFVVPTGGPDQFWDYSTNFDNVVAYTLTPTMPALESPYGNLFPLATHATHIPSLTGDSLYYYFYVDTLGFHAVGNFSFIPGATTSFVYSPTELMIPDEIHYLDEITDYSRAIGNFTYMTYAAQHRISSYVTYTADAYGTLALPLATYGDVMRVEEVRTVYDSIYADITGFGTYTFVTVQSMDIHRFHFMRNNTFGTTLLLDININQTGNPDYAWYVVPYQTGGIQGYVYDSESMPVTAGEAYLFRECSNFTRDDLLAVSSIDGSGSYHFDSIPFGQYFIGVRPDPVSYPNALFTYYGDTAAWVNASVLVFEDDTSNVNINLCYHDPMTGLGTIHGSVIENFGYAPGAKSTKDFGEPVPGAEIYLEQEPEGEPIVSDPTDESGSFQITDIPDGEYRLFVDIPGLNMSNTYNITILGGSVWNELDFVMGSDSVYAVNEVTFVNEVDNRDFFNIYPNPANDFITIESIGINAISGISLVGLDGKLIKEFDSNKKTIDIKGNSINPGAYFLRISCEKGQFFEKVIIN